MHELPPYRPPSEAHSVLIRVTRGCPWNRCGFCGMYKDIRFEIRPLDEIKADIEVARRIHHARTVFLGDSDNLVHPQLEEVLDCITKAFRPERITSYARAKTVAETPMERLALLRQEGLTRLHFGLESGDRKVLDEIKKGLTPEEAIKAGKKAKKAGFEVSEYVIVGIGGERWRDHAENTAKVLNEIEPDFIRLRTITVVPGTPLHWRMKKGLFKPTPPLERLKEVMTLVENLKCNAMLFSDHVSNYLWSDAGVIFSGVGGRLPDDKQKMLEELEDALRIAEHLNQSGKLYDSNDMFARGFIML
jgi:radical SAM superfamily enzyme YgiQ (UPF0313 family)